MNSYLMMSVSWGLEEHPMNTRTLIVIMILMFLSGWLLKSAFEQNRS